MIVRALALIGAACLLFLATLVALTTAVLLGARSYRRDHAADDPTQYAGA